MLAAVRPRIAGLTALLIISAALTACGAGGGGNKQGGNSPLIDTGQSQSGNSGTPTSNNQSANQSAQQQSSGNDSSATPGPGGNASVKVAQNEVTQGNLVITLSVDTAVRMVAPGASSAPTSPTPQPQQGQGQGAGAKTEMVLGEATQKITKNLDTSQGAPPDPKEAQGDYIRHVTIQVKDKSTGQVVPYLLINMDVLRDGRPIQYDQPLVPMVPSGGSADQMRYGNNIAFPGKGRYQLFVRIPPNALLGNNAPPSTQFEVDIQ